MSLPENPYKSPEANGVRIKSRYRLLLYLALWVSSTAMIIYGIVLMREAEMLPTASNLRESIGIGLSYAMTLTIGRLFAAVGVLILIVTTAFWWYSSPKRKKMFDVAGGKSIGH